LERASEALSEVMVEDPITYAIAYH